MNYTIIIKGNDTFHWQSKHFVASFDEAIEFATRLVQNFQNCTIEQLRIHSIIEN